MSIGKKTVAVFGRFTFLLHPTDYKRPSLRCEQEGLDTQLALPPPGHQRVLRLSQDRLLSWFTDLISDGIIISKPLTQSRALPEFCLPPVEKHKICIIATISLHRTFPLRYQKSKTKRVLQPNDKKTSNPIIKKGKRSKQRRYTNSK